MKFRVLVRTIEDQEYEVEAPSYEEAQKLLITVDEDEWSFTDIKEGGPVVMIDQGGMTDWLHGRSIIYEGHDHQALFGKDILP